MERSHEHLVPHPAWYGHRYPTREDLEGFAWDLRTSVVYGPVSKGAYFPTNPGFGRPAVIVIPEALGPLARTWSLAHELGHLVEHAGPKGEMFRRKNEAQANRWAARALIPEKRIRAYAKASIDAFIASLSANYEDIPFIDCPARSLAGEIARIRIKALEAA